MGRGAGTAQHQNSSQLAEILNPVLGIRDLQRRAGFIPIDHARHNRAAIRQQSRENKERRQRGEPATPDRLRGHIPASSRRGSSFVPPSGPSRVVEVSMRDYVRENAFEAAKAKARRPQTGDDDGRRWLAKEDFGMVPQYLQARKLDLAASEAEQQAAVDAALMPAGMRVMEETERQEMLAALSRSKADTEAQLRAMPFVVETPSQIHYKKRTEERLAEIEQALRIFSQRRVLVKTDE